MCIATVKLKLHTHHVDLVPVNSVYNIFMLLAVYMAHCVWGQWIIVGHGGRLGGSGPHTWWGVDFDIIDTWWQGYKSSYITGVLC